METKFNNLILIKTMILIIAPKDDHTAQTIVKYLPENQVIWLDTTFGQLNSFVDLDNEKLQIGKKSFDFEEIKSVYYRRNLDNIIRDEKVHIYPTKEHIRFVQGLEYVLPHAHWINKPSDNRSADFKVRQLILAKSLGFAIPKNTHFGDQVPVLEKEKTYILKTISGNLAYKTNRGKFYLIGTKTYQTNEFENVQNLGCPNILQEYTEKSYELRVTIVGKKIFAFRVNSQETGNKDTAVDFRNWSDSGLKFELIKMPPEIEQKCLQIMKKLNLVYGAIDLIVDKNGEYVFLEINPAGQYGWLDVLIKEKISKAITKELMKSIKLSI
jgi:glutathione synthase/RimK-type ligase-like ATP-grasp enzyme